MEKNIPDSASKITFPDTNEHTYRWRGDLGLLDRLSYKSRDEIPRNWKETSVDPLRIASSLSSREIELPTTHLLGDSEAHRDTNPTTDLEGAQNKGIRPDETIPPPKKRYP